MLLQCDHEKNRSRILGRSVAYGQTRSNHLYGEPLVAGFVPINVSSNLAKNYNPDGFSLESLSLKFKQEVWIGKSVQLAWADKNNQFSIGIWLAVKTGETFANTANSNLSRECDRISIGLELRPA